MSMGPYQTDEREGGANQDGGGGGDTGSAPLRNQDQVDGGTVEAENGLSSVDKAFDVVLVRERIIDYAMRHENGWVFCEEAIAPLRLVGRSWLDTVSRLLARENEPLYKINLTKCNSLVVSPSVQTNGKLLDQFVRAVDQRIETPFPTFRFKIFEEFFQQENYDSLKTFFMKCGQGLLELDMKVPMYGGSLPCNFSNLDLPSLQKVTVTLTNTKVPEPFGPSSGQVLGHSNVTHFLTNLFRNQSIYLMVFRNHSNVHAIPVGFQFITLPSFLTDLELDCVLKDCEAEILVRNSLPSLTTLILMVDNKAFSPGLLSRIMENLRKTLCFLTIKGLGYKGPPRVINFVSFPKMEKLECLDLYSINCELEEAVTLNQQFPKLEYFTLHNQTKSMFHKWTSGPPCTTVETMQLELVDDNLYPGMYFVLPITLENMQRLHLTFPNIQSLTLKLTGRQSCGLKYMFQEMRQLEVLKISVKESEYIADSVDWDSVLVGLPKGMVKEMHSHPDLWKNLEINKNQELPSITMLQELTTLCLCSSERDEEEEEDKPLISDLSFEFALLRMTKLKILELSGRFQASDKSYEAWNNEHGRTITDSYTHW